ncbi:MAG: hypothetical protein U0703_20095 [Anaerolineae bacterium]
MGGRSDLTAVILFLQMYWSAQSLLFFYTSRATYDPCAVAGQANLDQEIARQLNEVRIGRA